jgi:predicted enzyme related to lactoylglutathione lyase
MNRLCINFIYEKIKIPPANPDFYGNYRIACIGIKPQGIPKDPNPTGCEAVSKPVILYCYQLIPGDMENEIRFVHTNLVARDWKKLAQFYIDVFDCLPTHPERDLSGEWLDRMTRVQGARIRGMHLKLPGYDNGPTLEIFEYNKPGNASASAINKPGFGHLAFHVGSVEETLSRLTSCGGKLYGEMIETEVKGVGQLKAVYATDPEGNIIEIQNWVKK